MKERRANTAQVYGRKRPASATSEQKIGNRKDRHTRHLKRGTAPQFFSWRRRASEANQIGKNETVNVLFSHLPFNGPVTIKYVVDQNTSNVQKFIDAGTTPTLAGSALQMTEQYTGTVVNGALVLPAQAMTPSSVSLWTISIQ
jgi:hypothetical protein